jgi:hypothetical protein
MMILVIALAFVVVGAGLLHARLLMLGCVTAVRDLLEGLILLPDLLIEPAVDRVRRVVGSGRGCGCGSCSSSG